MIVSFEWEQFDELLWRLARTETGGRVHSVTWAGDAWLDDDDRWKAMEPDGSFTTHATADEAKKALVDRVSSRLVSVAGTK